MAPKNDLPTFTKLIGFMVVAAFLTVTLAMAWPAFRHDKELTDITVYLLGNLTGAALTVICFLYGSSAGSKAKEDKFPPVPGTIPKPTEGGPA